MPDVLREYLLATGDRGIGWQAVYGANATLTVEQFELLTWMQQRVALASSEEGRKQLARDQAIEQAIASADAADQASGADAAASSSAHRSIPPFDPETMSAAQVADWIARYGGGVRH